MFHHLLNKKDVMLLLRKPMSYCFPTETLKFRWVVGCIDWVICMCCQGPWNVSDNMLWWMRLWPGSEPARGAGVGAGNAPSASRLPTWHQNRWMPLIVTVCNVCSSIIPSLLTLCLSVVGLWRLPAECWSRGVYAETAVQGTVLFITQGRLWHIFLAEMSTARGVKFFFFLL